MRTEMTRIAALIMAKNEEKSIACTLNSIVNVVDSLVFWDTGSTDKTLEIVAQFHTDHREIDTYIGEGTFKDFAVSRNDSIAYAESIKGLTHVLILDAGDVVCSAVTKDQLKHLLEKNGHQKAFQVQKKWKHGHECTTYMIPLLFRLHEGCRYMYPVHEYLHIPDASVVYALDPTKIHVFQDRNIHGNSSPKRWRRDLEILLKEHRKNPFDPRIQFYLAQTHKCLGDNANAAKMYKMRYDNRTGFWEERFQAALSVGEIYAQEFGDENFAFTVLPWYMKALTIEMRVEPLLRIAEFYIRMKFWHIAFMFLNEAISLPESKSTLFVNKHEYDYTRYHLMGIVGYYIGNYEVGKSACKIAVDFEHKEVDTFNLQFYEKCQVTGTQDTNTTPKISQGKGIESIKEDVKKEEQ